MPKARTDSDALTASRFSITVDGHQIASFSELVTIVSEVETDNVATMLLKKLPGKRTPPTVTLNGATTRTWESSPGTSLRSTAVPARHARVPSSRCTTWPASQSPVTTWRTPGLRRSRSPRSSQDPTTRSTRPSRSRVSACNASLCDCVAAPRGRGNRAESGAARYGRRSAAHCNSRTVLPSTISPLSIIANA